MLRRVFGIGQSKPSAKCNICGLELLEENILKHRKDCSQLSAEQDADGHLSVNYQGPENSNPMIPITGQNIKQEPPQKLTSKQ